MGEKSVTDLINELKKVDFNKMTQTILGCKIGGLGVNSLDFLLDWKYEIVKIPVIGIPFQSLGFIFV